MGILNQLIEKAYDLFSGNRPGEELDACTFCCMTEEEEKGLMSTPLRLISVELLRKYQDAAKPEKLNIGEVKYFAPRYLDLLKDNQFPSFEPSLSLTRFGAFKAWAWTKKETELLDQFVSLKFQEYLQAKPKQYSISPISLLLMFHKGNFDVRPLLKAWEGFRGRESVQHFGRLLEEVKVGRDGRIKVLNAFSDEKFDQLIVDWLESEGSKGLRKRARKFS